MSGNLLDTNAALIALADPDRLSGTARKAVLAGPNVLSVVSYWEVVLKSMKGNLDVGDPGVLIAQAIAEGLRLVTLDEEVRKYTPAGLRVLT